MYKSLLDTLISIFVGIYPEAELLDRVVIPPDVLRKRRTVFLGGRTLERPHVPMSPPVVHSHDVLVLIRAPLADVRRCLPVALICTSLMVGDVERLFVSLLAICMSSGEMSVQVRCPFFN